MKEESRGPVHNLKVVLLETGINADTLRAWERRYGLPTPERSSGGHRLFTQRDIDTVKWLLARQDEGLRISLAVELWEGFEANGQDPLEELSFPTLVPETRKTDDDAIEELRSAWVDACKSFDEQHAMTILNQAFTLYPRETVCLDLLTPALAEFGEGWYAAKITVQQEHFASELAIRCIESLISSSPPPTLPGKVLVLCPPGEEHIFSPLLITSLIKMSGSKAIFLGANVPVERINEVIETTDPNLVILTAQQLHSAASLSNMSSRLSERNILTVYGGRIFNLLPEIKERIQGQFLGKQIRDVPSVVDHILHNPIDMPVPGTSNEETKRTLAEFLLNQATIESRVLNGLTPDQIPTKHIVIANSHLAKKIVAALELGDIAFISHDLDWIGGLLKNHGFSEENLTDFLGMYAEAIEFVVGVEGKIITNYLSEVIT